MSYLSAAGGPAAPHGGTWREGDYRERDPLVAMFHARPSAFFAGLADLLERRVEIEIGSTLGVLTAKALRNYEADDEWGAVGDRS